MNCLKKQVQDLSVGAAKLERATFVVANATAQVRSREVASTAPGVGIGATETSLTASERPVKSAAAAAGTAAHARGGRSGSNPSGRSPERQPGQCGPMGWNRDWEEGETASDTKETGAAATSATNDIAPAGKIQEDTPVARAVSAPPASTERAQDGDGEGVGLGEAKEVTVETKQAAESTTKTETEPVLPKEVCPPAGRKMSRRCPLSGILDMSEPALRQHRPSCYSEDGIGLTSPTTPTTTAATRKASAMGVEPLAEEEDLSSCVVTSDGFVHHAENCVLKNVPQNKASVSEAFKLKTNTSVQALGAESQRLRGSSVSSASSGVLTRKRSNFDPSEWDPAECGGTGRSLIQLVGPRSWPCVP